MEKRGRPSRSAHGAPLIGRIIRALAIVDDLQDPVLDRLRGRGRLHNRRFRPIDLRCDARGRTIRFDPEADGRPVGMPKQHTLRAVEALLDLTLDGALLVALI